MALSIRRAKKFDDGLIVDRLTGAFNRRQFDLDLASGVDPSGLSTATLMINIDDFGKFTGKRGIETGDQILERVAWVVMATVRTSDIVYRHKNSSFCVLLPATSDADSAIVAERIRSNIESTPLLCDSNVTVSVGRAIGSSTAVGETAERADAALDRAGSAAHNCVVAAAS